MLPVALWWLWAEVLGLVMLPFTFALFRNLPDRGYAFSKAVGLLTLGYLLWLAGSLHILPNTSLSIFLLLALLAAGSAFLLHRRVGDFLAIMRGQIGYILAAEAVFATFFLGWALLRAYTPSIAHTEQPMDFAFLNATYRSRYFPPLDPWLSGFSISYYYFGYLLSAMMSKLTGIAPAYGYNLALALFAALAALGAFGLVYNLVRRPDGSFRRAVAFGIVAAALLLVVSNLEGVLELIYARGWGPPRGWEILGISGLNAPYTSPHWYPAEHWWWWRATRILDGGSTISEFPFFSFMLGDLHPHVMALPFTLVTLGMGVNLFFEPAWARIRPHLPYLLALCLALGGLAFINVWDFPTYFVLILGLLLLRTYLGARASFPWRRSLALFGIILAGSLVLYLPYYLTARGLFAKGILPAVTQESSPFQLFLIWGLFLFIALSFLGIQSGALRRAGALKVRGFLTSTYPFWALLGLWLAAATAYILVRGEGGGWDLMIKMGQVLPWLAILSLALFLIRARLRRAREGWGDDSSFMALLLLFLGFLIIAGVELFFVLDVFGNRMNTVFKLHYQAWTLLALASGFGLYYISHAWAGLGRSLGRGLWWAGLGLFLVASLAYTFAAPWTKTGAFAGPPTLNGLSQLEREEPEKYRAIQWLNENVSGAPVILTAPSNEWDYSAIMVSASTGLPTVLGWPDHELQWRGSRKLFLGRREDMDLIYATQDVALARQLLKKYSVRYIYVGPEERRRYGAESLAKFDAFLEVAYPSDGVTIYRVVEG
ncbi:MAG: hypothetical protein HY676_00845 [Chloroflexi bacterium]|nr:hypothetical protein [Chloroflexota bacterium]